MRRVRVPGVIQGLIAVYAPRPRAGANSHTAPADNTALRNSPIQMFACCLYSCSLPLARVLIRIPASFPAWQVRAHQRHAQGTACRPCSGAAGVRVCLRVPGARACSCFRACLFCFACACVPCLPCLGRAQRSPANPRLWYKYTCATPDLASRPPVNTVSAVFGDDPATWHVRGPSTAPATGRRRFHQRRAPQ